MSVNQSLSNTLAPPVLPPLPPPARFARFIPTPPPLVAIAVPDVERHGQPHARPLLPPAESMHAAATADEVWSIRRLVISSALSTIVHLLLLIMLGLMVAMPKRDVAALTVLEVSVASIPEAKVVGATRIETTMPKSTAAAQRPSGSPNVQGAQSSMLGPGGGEKIGVKIGAPKLPGVAGAARGGDATGDDKAVGSESDDPSTTGDGHGATFFGVPAAGKKIAFVVDTSGSMNDNERYLRCRAELIESLRSLKTTQYYFVVFFSTQWQAMPGRRLTDASPYNINKTISWINRIGPAGTTEPVAAMKVAMQQKPDAIFLLTDGSFEEGAFEKIMKLQSASKKIPIHTIAFENEAGEDMLKNISRATGGRYRYVP